MDVFEYEVPSWLAVLVVAMVGVSFFYGVLLETLDQVFALWWGTVGLGLSLFVVYLFYRFVVAVEEIADKL